MKCPCNLPHNVPTECDTSWVNEPLAERVRKMKHNRYMTKEDWEKKIIQNVNTGEWYSYADIDRLINN